MKHLGTRTPSLVRLFVSQVVVSCSDILFFSPPSWRMRIRNKDWQIWTAGLVTDTAVRDIFVKAVHDYAADGQNNAPLGDWYETLNGQAEGFRARPVVGGHLALVSGPSPSLAYPLMISPAAPRVSWTSVSTKPPRELLSIQIELIYDLSLPPSFLCLQSFF